MCLFSDYFSCKVSYCSFCMVLLCYKVDKLRKWKQDQVEQMASDLEDDAMSGSDVDRRLSDLRKEVN